ncbi:hypothetical protein L3X38_025777 [Prunus dulcis]|uniref:Uncharacterized protein n=1 Tax=Prunus dulcis TaxID=3755 RepID=A0AAD4W3Z0_PRUDU|nr:hypothetical protein L3X38_025777 [Prunus dulcis]
MFLGFSSKPKGKGIYPSFIVRPREQSPEFSFDQGSVRTSVKNLCREDVLLAQSSSSSTVQAVESSSSVIAVIVAVYSPWSEVVVVVGAWVCCKRRIDKGM